MILPVAGHDRAGLLICCVNVFVNLATGYYLVALPVSEFTRSFIWASALELIPARNPATLGVAFVAAGVLVPFARAFRDHVAVFGWAGLTIGAASWGLLAGSFGYAAHEHGGLGALGLIAAVAFAVLHLGLLLLARPHHRD